MTMLTDHLLTVITFFPVLGAVLLLFVPTNDENGKNLARWIALATTLVTFLLSL